MKKIASIILILISVISYAQEKRKEVKTVTFKVSGNCEQCKNRIENAADIKGVKLAKWDVKTKTLEVTYRVDKVSEAEIKKAILNAGHDVDGEKAPETVYNKLPKCCKYRDTKCEK
ncbi:MAG TPA: heavy-metal-associated domain-containing protein [Bacteroidia bacterium]|jgi:copper chaperone CopZ|nr:heavy-metal-associated domain-containing protein [Bacteroidia bacterium]